MPLGMFARPKVRVMIPCRLGEAVDLWSFSLGSCRALGRSFDLRE